MHRLPLADELPYRFHPPRPSRFWMRATRGLRSRLLRDEHRIAGIAFQGLEHLQPLLDRGDGILLTPNHCGRADGLVLLNMADHLGKTFCGMAAYQIFEGTAGARHFLFPRLGIFPVDREGSDLAAFKTAVSVVSEARHPLLVFPEGEVYHLGDRLTPLRDGAAALALAAAKRLNDRGKTAWIVPVGLKYRFPDDFDPRPAFHERMAAVENLLTWRPRVDQALVERIYHFAVALLCLKEFEHLGAPRQGPLTERLADLQQVILKRIEARRRAGRRADAGGQSVPVRVKDMRKACLDVLADPKHTPEDATQARHDLDDLFFVLQAYSYQGDYVRECPSLERIGETLMKLEEDLLLERGCYAAPLGPRRVDLRIGPPINVAEHLGGPSRAAVPNLTVELETRIKSLLDAIGPGSRREVIPDSFQESPRS